MKQTPAKTKVGRPTLYRPVMLRKTRAYLHNCPDAVPTYAGLACALNIGEQTLKQWKSCQVKDLDVAKYPLFAEFQSALFELRTVQKRELINQGLKGKYNSTIAKLMLACNHGMRESADTGTGQPLIVLNFGTGGAGPHRRFVASQEPARPELSAVAVRGTNKSRNVG